MNHFAEIFSYVALCIMLLVLMVSLAIKAHAAVPQAEAELPIKVEIFDCRTQDKVQDACYSYGYCCDLLEPASGDYVTPEWTPMGEQQGIDVMPEDVIVE